MSTNAAATPAILAKAHVIPPRGAHQQTVVWMHGLGDSSEGFRSLFEQIAPPNTRVVLPNAPVRPITVNGGYKMNAWYNIESMDRSDGLARNEDEKGIEDSSKNIKELLDHEAKLVGSSEKIILGGFSQGGAMSLHAGLSYPQRLGGIVSASGYLLLRSKYPECMSEHAKTVPILAYHGKQDPVVPLIYANTGYEVLKKNGVKDNLKLIYEDDLEHSLSNDELKELILFFKRVWKL